MLEAGEEGGLGAWFPDCLLGSPGLEHSGLSQCLAADLHHLLGTHHEEQKRQKRQAVQWFFKWDIVKVSISVQAAGK